MTENLFSHLRRLVDVDKHPAYDDSLRSAIDRAYCNPGACFSVWFDGEAIFVRDSKAAGPPNGVLVCIAERWDANTVQVRFTGARSEWFAPYLDK